MIRVYAYWEKGTDTFISLTPFLEVNHPFYRGYATKSGQIWKKEGSKFPYSREIYN